MKQAIPYCIFLFLILSILPGCIRVINWGKKTLYQGEQLDVNDDVAMDSIRKKYIRSVTIYDQLVTRALFEALWLSDEVRAFNTDMYSRRLGKISDQEKLFLRRQREENDSFISFYLLSAYNVPLGDLTSKWGLFLRVGDSILTPIELKVVDLPVEYVKIFGSMYNQFKVAYYVSFNKIDATNKSVITSNTTQLQLYLRTFDKEASLVWPLKVQ